MQVTLLDHMGSDLDIVNAARVSYNKRSHLMVDELGYDVLREEDRGLINYLMKNHHGTPFEMGELKFHVSCPIAVAREWHRHRIASVNEVSTRYVELEENCYIPRPEDMRRQVGKPGHYTFEKMTLTEACHAAGILNHSYQKSLESYRNLLGMGVAKEVARNSLPLGIYTEFYWKLNVRSFFNFSSLRLAPSALAEIRYCAEQAYQLAEPLFPESFKAWNKYSRPQGEDFHDCDNCDYTHGD